MCIMKMILDRVMRPFLPVMLDMMGVREMYPLSPNHLGDYGRYRLPPSLTSFLLRGRRQ